MRNEPVEVPDSIRSKNRLHWAGLAAFVGCAACCALPLLAASGLGGGISASVAAYMRPGSEILVGAAVFGISLAIMALLARRRQGRGCGPACATDGSCCNRP